MQFRSRIVRCAPPDERQSSPLGRLFAQLNLLAEKLQLGRSRGRRDCERRAHRIHQNLSRRAAPELNRLAVALMTLTSRVLTVRRFIAQNARQLRLPFGKMRTSQKMKVLGAVLFVIVAAGETLHAQQTESLDKLAGDFWTWRARYAPFNGDDVPRMERPGGMRDWSRAKIVNHRSELAEFESRWKKVDIKGWPVPKQVDYSLIGSALSRVRWELD